MGFTQPQTSWALVLAHPLLKVREASTSNVTIHLIGSSYGLNGSGRLLQTLLDPALLAEFVVPPEGQDRDDRVEEFTQPGQD
ncbi:hypothetical protein [Telmatospirillum sp. J64-1]|uniref:hypothetical protein n=1 Tax=Telmatospirillum sp. J64-1 TaxID=2502183 RepID=UPI00115E84EF|nr:hypothetical protein [Telmatospirillum sp. J64-1]